MVLMVLQVILVFLEVVLGVPSKQRPLKLRPHYRVIDVCSAFVGKHIEFLKDWAILFVHDASSAGIWVMSSYQ